MDMESTDLIKCVVVGDGAVGKVQLSDTTHTENFFLKPSHFFFCIDL